MAPGITAKWVEVVAEIVNAFRLHRLPMRGLSEVLPRPPTSALSKSEVMPLPPTSALSKADREAVKESFDELIRLNNKAKEKKN